MDNADGCGGTNINPKEKLKTPKPVKIPTVYGHESVGLTIRQNTYKESSVFVPPEDKITPMPDNIFDNMYNVGGNKINAQITNGQATKENTSVDTLLGFLSDGEMGKGSKFVVNNDVSNIKEEFLSQLDTDQNASISRDEYMGQMRNLEQQRQESQSKGDEYYGKSIVQYSEEKAKASFNAMDKNNDGQIDKTESDNFFNKTLKKDENPFVRNENGSDTEYKNTSSIDFTALPKGIQNATKTEEKEHLKDDYTQKTTVKGSPKFLGGGRINIADYKIDKKREITGGIEKHEDEEKLLQALEKFAEPKKSFPLKDLYKAAEKVGFDKEKTNKLLNLEDYLESSINRKDINELNFSLNPDMLKKIEELKQERQDRQSHRDIPGT